MSEEQFLAELETQGTDLETFSESAKKNTLIQMQSERLRDAVITEVALSEDEVRAYFEAHRADFEVEEEVRASHILVETEEEIGTILERLDAGEAFADLASELSIDPGSAAEGGDLGWFGRGRMVPEFEDAAFSLEVDELSEPVQTQYGFHLILVTERQDAETTTFEEVADDVRNAAEGEERDLLFDAWFAEREAGVDLDVRMPLVAAAMLMDEDLDAAAAAFEALVDDEDVDDPYLQFYIGQIYETKMRTTLEEQAMLEASTDRTPEDDEAIEQMAVDAEGYRLQAIDAFELALANLGVDAALQSRLDRLHQAGSDEEQDAGE
jgi:parvulin-like peptidyl-prolyl isomerase